MTCKSHNRKGAVIALLSTLCCTLIVSFAFGQTVVLTNEQGDTETFDKPEGAEEGSAAGAGTAKTSWETIQLGDIKINLPTTYEISLDRGDILGHPYFARFIGVAYPDIFVMDTVFEGDIEELANSFFSTYLQGRFQLRSLRYLSGAPRKLVLDVQGMEMTYQIYFVSLNQRNSFLMFVVPVPPKSGYAELGEQVVGTVRLY